MVALLDRLEELELARRALDPEDRRRYAVTLRDGGRRTLEHLKEEVLAVERAMLTGLDDEELERLRGLLVKLLRSV